MAEFFSDLAYADGSRYWPVGRQTGGYIMIQNIDLGAYPVYIAAVDLSQYQDVPPADSPGGRGWMLNPGESMKLPDPVSGPVPMMWTTEGSTHVMVLGGY